MFEFTLPSLGADMDRGTLLKWNVVVGQPVRKGDVVAVVDTSKAAIDVECWRDGVVHRLVAEVGQTVPCGGVLALLLAPGEAAPAPEAAAAVAVAAPAPIVEPMPTRPAAPTAPAPAMTTAAVAQPAPSSPRMRVSPAARQRAVELGADPARAAATGPGGAVTRDDIERLAASVAPPAAVATPLDRGAEMRRLIAATMSRSKREIPHYYLAETVPLQRALDWLHVANEQRDVTRRLLPAVLLLKAVALAVREYPEINGRFDDGVFWPSAAVHVGVAISLRHGGLIAPALHDVGAMPLDTLMAELADLVRRCRAGGLRSSELSDPTLTVTNLGEQGAEAVYGVIYPPQVALIGFGRIAERPWAAAGQVTSVPAVTATLSADHRVSDGHRGALFLTRLGDLLQRPEDL